MTRSVLLFDLNRFNAMPDTQGLTNLLTDDKLTHGNIRYQVNDPYQYVLGLLCSVFIQPHCGIFHSAPCLFCLRALSLSLDHMVV